MKLVQNIVNTCNQIAGIEPTIYFAFREDCKFTKTNNVISAVDIPFLGVISGVKNFCNAGSDDVESPTTENGFKHKLNAIINQSSDVLDKLEDVIFFVTTKDGKSLAYGVEHGMWKDSQSQMFNDNLGAVTAGWSSLDGQEEKYSEYFVTADLTVIPNANNYDVVSGGSIAQGDDYYYLSVSPAAKIGYIYLPNKTRVQTNGGGVATAAYTGISGDITFYIDKTASSFLIKYLSDLTSAVISTSPAVSAFQDC